MKKIILMLADLQKITDDNTGEKMTVVMGRLFIQLEQNAIDRITKEGGIVNINLLQLKMA